MLGPLGVPFLGFVAPKTQMLNVKSVPFPFVLPHEGLRCECYGNVNCMLGPLGCPFWGPPVVTAAGGLTFNIPLTCALEAPIRQNKGTRDKTNI